MARRSTGRTSCVVQIDWTDMKRSTMRKVVQGTAEIKVRVADKRFSFARVEEIARKRFIKRHPLRMIDPTTIRTKSCTTGKRS